MLLITVHPGYVAPEVLAAMHGVVAVGESPENTLRGFSEALGQTPPVVAPVALQPGEALFWARHAAGGVEQFRIAPSRTERVRHRRKYAQGDLGVDRSFYFRGPQRHLNLRAQNLMLFMQMAEGLDDNTWLYHLRQGDYSQWFRDAIKDEELATQAADIEQQGDLSAAESRQRLGAAIEERYTLAAAPAASITNSAEKIPNPIAESRTSTAPAEPPR